MADAVPDDLQVAREGATLHLRLHRPQARNAINPAMYDGLRAALATAAADDTLTAVLLSAAGATFCAGNDIAGLQAVRALPMDERPGFRFMQALAAFPKPVVAAVAGRAVGIGATLLLHCDLVYLEPDATLLLPFARLGLVPEFASSLLLPRMAGHARAARWLLLGEPMSAHDARDVGLATEVVATGTALACAQVACAAMADLSSPSLIATKALMREGVEARVRAVMVREMAQLSEFLDSPATQARLAAGRTPRA